MVNAVERLLRFQMKSVIDRSPDFFCCDASATTLVIYARNQRNTFRLNGSLTTQFFDKKVEMAIDTVNVKAVEGTSSTRRGREREIVESEMNNLKRHQQPHLTKLTFYSSTNK